MAPKRKRDASQQEEGASQAQEQEQGQASSSACAPLVDWPVGSGVPQAARLQLWEEHSGDSQLWEFTLRAADGTSVPASRLDLCERSAYFRALLLGEFKDSRLSEHSLEEVRGDDLRNAVRSLYSNQVALSWDNAGRMLALASRLQLGELRAACCAYLEQNLPEAHALEVLLLADQYSCDQLRSAARDAWLHSPADLLLPHVERCSAAQLTELLSANELRLRELAVHHAVCAWCQHHSKTPEELAALLCKIVKYERLAASDWPQLLNSPQVQGNALLLLQFAKQLAPRACSRAVPLPCSHCHTPPYKPCTKWVASGEPFAVAAPFTATVGQRVRSKPYNVKGLPHFWRLVVFSGGKSRSSAAYVSIYLECLGAYNDDPPPKILCELGVMHPSQSGNTLRAGRTVTTLDFSCGSNSYGLPNGVSRDKLKQEGFINPNGAIVAYAKVSVPSATR